MQFAFEGLYFDGVGMPQRVCRFPGLLLPTHAAVMGRLSIYHSPVPSFPVQDPLLSMTVTMGAREQIATTSSRRRALRVSVFAI
jgi:hypothetical protein